MGPVCNYLYSPHMYAHFFLMKVEGFSAVLSGASVEKKGKTTEASRSEATWALCSVTCLLTILTTLASYARLIRPPKPPYASPLSRSWISSFDPRNVHQIISNSLLLPPEFAILLEFVSANPSAFGRIAQTGEPTQSGRLTIYCVFWSTRRTPRCALHACNS